MKLPPLACILAVLLPLFSACDNKEEKEATDTPPPKEAPADTRIAIETAMGEQMEKFGMVIASVQDKPTWDHAKVNRRIKENQLFIY